MTPDPARRLAQAIEHADLAVDRLAAALHALAELEEQCDEDQPDPDLDGKIASAEAAVAEAAGSIAKCESPIFAGVCPSETPLGRTYCHLDLDQRRTLFRLIEARMPVGEIAARLGRHPSTVYHELGRNRFRDGDRGFCGYVPLNTQDLARRPAGSDGKRADTAARPRALGTRCPFRRGPRAQLSHPTPRGP